MSSSDHVLATPSLPPQPSIAAITAPPRLTFGRPSSQPLKGTRCECCRAKGHDISICPKPQKFMQEQNKAPPPRASAICPLDLLVPIGSSLSSSLTTTNIEEVVQQVLSRTSTAISITLGNHSWFFDIACCNHDP